MGPVGLPFGEYARVVLTAGVSVITTKIHVVAFAEVIDESDDGLTALFVTARGWGSARAGHAAPPLRVLRYTTAEFGVLARTANRGQVRLNCVRFDFRSTPQVGSEGTGQLVFSNGLMGAIVGNRWFFVLSALYFAPSLV